MRRVFKSIAITLSLFLLPINPANGAISGTKCTKSGTTKIVGNIKYTCVKQGSKLVWNKGISIKPAVKTTPSPTPTATPTPTVSSTPSPEPSPTASVTPKAPDYVLSSASEFENLEVCRLKTQITTPQNNGFPRNPINLNSTGTIRGITLFVDYSDLPATGDEIRVWKTQQIPTAENAFRAMSYGKMQLKIDTLDKVLHVNKSVLSYNMDTPHGSPFKANANPGGIVRDAAIAADTEIDFSKYDFLNVVTPATSLIGSEGALGIDLSLDGKRFTEATFGSIREYKDDETKYFWLVHEMGHLLGLMHPYAWGKGNIPVWDVMGSGVTVAPEYLLWHKFLLGWLDQNNVRCALQPINKKITAQIYPIGDRTQNLKGLILKLSDSQLLVIEYRKKSDLDAMLPREEGVLVYTVNTNAPDNGGAINILNEKLQLRNEMWMDTLKVGGAINYMNLEIRVLSENDSSVIISVS